MNDFIRERVCFYSSVLKGKNSTWEIARSAVEHGVAGIELMNFSSDFQSPDMAFAKEIGAFAKQNGLKLPCFSCAVNFAQNPKEGLSYIKRYADICSELEIPFLHHTLIMEWEYASVVGREEGLLELAVECALELNEYAKGKGVQTLVEEQGYVVNGVERYSSFVKKTGGKIGVLFDTSNIMFLDETPEAFYRAFPQVSHVHIKDFKRSERPLEEGSYQSVSGQYLTECAYGEGVVKMDLLAKELKKNDYKGYFSSECPPCESDEAVKNMLEKIAFSFGER